MPVSSEKEKMLQDRMKSLGVAETDLEETFIRSSGPGGQKVNKSSSCVYLRHLPTGLSVKCQKERSQSLNRFLARRLLLDKIEIQQKGLMAEARQTIEKSDGRKGSAANEPKKKF